jgi:monoamine oxidase
MTFVPEFSLDLKNAISGIGMRKGSVVILKYSERFWPQNMKSLFGGQIVQEYRNTLFGERTGTDYCIKAFLFGKHQTEAQILGNSLISEINLELDSIFGNGIATSSFISSYSYTWGDNPWIPGVQSFSNVGNSSSRPYLANPIHNRVYLAGEATHAEGHHGTIHGAMETAVRAVNQILEDQ